MSGHEAYFRQYREKIVGIDQRFRSPVGEVPMVYADWTASGRLYHPIEQRMAELFGPWVGNTHSESSATGETMTIAYLEAREIIRRHIHASPDDVLLTGGAGMTALVNKFQRILGLKAPEPLRPRLALPDAERPVVFVTHMEHHSNHTSWYECLADVHVIPPDTNGIVDTEAYEEMIARYRDRPLKIGAFAACSNVTGVMTPLHELARITHRYGGMVAVDFAASAPYVPIDMHPDDPGAALDAVMFSPHKFLGGPGSSGVLAFNKRWYRNTVPDDTGGGTVGWTNPWGGYSFVEDIETREDGGTPAFLQTIRAALAVRLKESMGTDRMKAREEELVERAFRGLRAIPRVHVLANNISRRLGMFSFIIEDMHYNLLVRMLNDRFGIQSRGGCSCAGTYGHYLLHVDPSRSKRITDKIDAGDLSEKPGWVRLSFHPTTTDEELDACIFAVQEIVNHGERWKQEYRYSTETNEFMHVRADDSHPQLVRSWFTL